MDGGGQSLIAYDSEIADRKLISAKTFTARGQRKADDDVV